MSEGQTIEPRKIGGSDSKFGESGFLEICRYMQTKDPKTDVYLIRTADPDDPAHVSSVAMYYDAAKFFQSAWKSGQSTALHQAVAAAHGNPDFFAQRLQEISSQMPVAPDGARAGAPQAFVAPSLSREFINNGIVMAGFTTIGVGLRAAASNGYLNPAIARQAVPVIAGTLVAIQVGGDLYHGNYHAAAVDTATDALSIGAGYATMWGCAQLGAAVGLGTAWTGPGAAIAGGGTTLVCMGASMFAGIEVYKAARNWLNTPTSVSESETKLRTAINNNHLSDIAKSLVDFSQKPENQNLLSPELLAAARDLGTPQTSTITNWQAGTVQLNDKSADTRIGELLEFTQKLSSLLSEKTPQGDTLRNLAAQHMPGKTGSEFTVIAQNLRTMRNAVEGLQANGTAGAAGQRYALGVNSMVPLISQWTHVAPAHPLQFTSWDKPQDPPQVTGSKGPYRTALTNDVVPTGTYKPQTIANAPAKTNPAPVAPAALRQYAVAP
jgi:hypothetical protein